MAEEDPRIEGSMGSMSYTNQRDNFDKLLKKYLEYLELYRQLNNGSTDGASTYDEFYIRFTYLNRYADPTQVQRTGY